MKITVYGGTNSKVYTDKQKTECEKLGKALASMGAEVLTGACGGFPYFVGKAAVQGGSKVWGYSPAINQKEHEGKFGYPMDGVTDMIYKGTGGTAESLLKRMQDMVPFAPIAVALGGSWGTYYELILAFWYKKTVILVEEFGGAVEAFMNTYEFFGKRDVNPAVHLGPTIIRVKCVDEAIKKIIEYKSNNKEG